MAEDYKRALCVACPFEADCRNLREGVHCHTCTKGLVCGSQGLLAQRDCDYVKKLWAALPRKCLLVGSRLKEQKVDPMELFQYVEGAPAGDGEEQAASYYRCPRCNQPRLIVGKQHNFRSQLERPRLGASRLSSLGLIYYASCDVCGVDDVHKT